MSVISRYDKDGKLICSGIRLIKNYYFDSGTHITGNYYMVAERRQATFPAAKFLMLIEFEGTTLRIIKDFGAVITPAVGEGGMCFDGKHIYVNGHYVLMGTTYCLFKFTTKGELVRYTASSTLVPSEDVKSLSIDGKYLYWLMTNDVIHMMDSDTQKVVRTFSLGLGSDYGFEFDGFRHMGHRRVPLVGNYIRWYDRDGNCVRSLTLSGIGGLAHKDICTDGKDIIVVR